MHLIIFSSLIHHTPHITIPNQTKKTNKTFTTSFLDLSAFIPEYISRSIPYLRSLLLQISKIRSICGSQNLTTEHRQSLSKTSSIFLKYSRALSFRQDRLLGISLSHIHLLHTLLMDYLLFEFISFNITINIQNLALSKDHILV